MQLLPPQMVKMEKSRTGKIYSSSDSASVKSTMTVLNGYILKRPQNYYQESNANKKENA